MSNINQKYLTVAFLLIITVAVSWKKIEYNYYKYFKQNDAVKIMEMDAATTSTYEQILQFPEFRGKPSFIYFNTSFSFDRLIKDTPDLYKLYKHYEDGELNLIYIANGLENDPERKQKWEFYINKLNPKGYHIALPSGYKDFDTFFRTTKVSEGNTYTDIPHYLLADKNGNITDTVYKSSIDIDRIIELIK